MRVRCRCFVVCSRVCGECVDCVWWYVYVICVDDGCDCCVLNCVVCVGVVGE